MNYLHFAYKQSLSSERMLTIGILFQSKYCKSNLLIEKQISKYKLEKENIEARPVWKPMHIQPVFEKYDPCIPPELLRRAYATDKLRTDEMKKRFRDH